MKTTRRLGAVGDCLGRVWGRCRGWVAGDKLRHFWPGVLVGAPWDWWTKSSAGCG